MKSQAQIYFGPEAGFTAAGLYNSGNVSYDGTSEVYAGLNGHIGVTAHFQINDFLAVRPSLLYRFGTMEYSDFNTDKISLNRIALPIPIMYSHVFPNNGIVFGGVGPNFMYNLSGTQSWEGGSQKISFSGDSASLKRFDVGLHFKGGYQFASGLSLSMFFNAGLSNISPVADTKLHSLDAFGFSIGWMFGGSSSDY